MIKKLLFAIIFLTFYLSAGFAQNYFNTVKINSNNEFLDYTFGYRFNLNSKFYELDQYEGLKEGFTVMVFENDNRVNTKKERICFAFKNFKNGITKI